MRECRIADREPLRVAGLGLLTALLVLILPVATASAIEYEFKSSFDGSDAVGVESPTFSNGGVQSIDIDQEDGTVYVGTTNNRVYKFNSEGASQPFSGLGGNTVFPQGVGSFGDVEVDNSGTATQGNIYVVNDSSNFWGYSPAGTALPGYPVNNTGETCGLAVAPDGHLWAALFPSTVREYDTTTTPPTFLESITLSPPVSALCDFDIDSQGRFLVPNAYYGGEVFRYNATGTAREVVDSATSNKSVAADLSNDHIYADVGDRINYYEAPGLFVQSFGLPEGEYPGLDNSRGLAVNKATHEVYVANNRTGSTRVELFGPNDGPEVTTGGAGSLTRTTATVAGHVDLAEKPDVTDCYFKYGETTAYELGTVPCTPAATPGSPFTGPQDVTADLASLTAGTTYHYRLFADNGLQIGKGADATFTTAEAVLLSTDPASEVGTTTATLNGTIDPEGFDVTYYFEYGPTTNYGRATAAHPGVPLGTTTAGDHSVAAPIENLVPGREYHYRVVAVNETGTSVGDDQAFQTFQPPSIESATTINVTANSADVVARINPKGYETTYSVEYGTTPAYGSVAPIPADTLAAGDLTQTVTVHLSSLEGVTYHFRVVAESQWGATRSPDQTFNFYPSACPNATVRQQTSSAHLPDCRAYELVSPEYAGTVLLRSGIQYPAPEAVSPPRIAYGGALGAIPGFDTISNTVDKYVSTRTDAGWETSYVGIRGSEANQATRLYGGRDFSKLIDFRGQAAPLSAPYVWDSSGNLVGRWPPQATSIPGGDAGGGAWQPSPDFSHLLFSSNTVAFDPLEEGLTTAPGSAYDYDAATGTTTIISKTPAGDDIPSEPTNPATAELVRFPGGAANGTPALSEPGVSIDGSRVLMSTREVNNATSPVHLYMRVDNAITYDVSHGHLVSYEGMTNDGSAVFFTSAEQLSGDDTDASIDLFMWAAEDDSIARISGGAGAVGNSDTCTASWIAGCGVELVSTGPASDNAIARENGAVLVYSPEQLAGPEFGSAGARNLYLLRDGAVHFVAELGAAVTRVQLSADGRHAAFVTTDQLTPYDNTGFAQMYDYDIGTERVRCVSCNPSGVAPTTDILASTSGLFMTDDGRTFWSTKDTLVPKDTNGLIDVYEFVEGRPQLISSGTAELDHRTSSGDAAFVGVSADGVNAYFSTFDTLVAQDLNGPYLKFYDARTNGGFPPPPVDLPCVAADECHGDASSAPHAPRIVSGADLGETGNIPPRRRARRCGRRAKPKRRTVRMSRLEARKSSRGRGTRRSGRACRGKRSSVAAKLKRARGRNAHRQKAERGRK